MPRAVWIPLPQTGSYMGSVIINMERKAKANKIRVAKGGFKFFDWQIAQSRVCFVPLYENKKI